MLKHLAEATDGSKPSPVGTVPDGLSEGLEAFAFELLSPHVIGAEDLSNCDGVTATANL